MSGPQPSRQFYNQGTDNKSAKLTEDDVRLIRALDAERRRLEQEIKNLSHTEIAAKFEINPHHVWAIVNYKKWRHL